MERITQKQLNAMVESLNSWDPGMDYSLDYAYGGIKLAAKGGDVDVLHSEFVTRRKCYELIAAYKAGIRRGTEIK
jgi:hypothetical protein